MEILKYKYLKPAVEFWVNLHTEKETKKEDTIKQAWTCVCVCVCANAAAACFRSWQCLPGIIHGTHPISRSACATHVFLFNLLVFSSSATTRTLPAIFFPARDKRIPDVRGWNVPSPPPHPFPSSCAVTSLRQPLHSHSLLSPSFPLFCFPEACPSLVRYVGTLSCAHLPPAPTGWLCVWARPG